MKKNISFVPMDSVLETWLLEKLMKEPPKSNCVEDLLSGLRDMISGEVSSLLLGASEESELPMGAVPDGMMIENWRFTPKAERY